MDWRYRTTAGGWASWQPGQALPADIATASVLDPDEPNTPVWNDRLVFSLQGGVAVGRTQGATSESAQLLDHARPPVR